MCLLDPLTPHSISEFVIMFYSFYLPICFAALSPSLRSCAAFRLLIVGDQWAIAPTRRRRQGGFAPPCRHINKERSSLTVIPTATTRRREQSSAPPRPSLLSIVRQNCIDVVGPFLAVATRPSRWWHSILSGSVCPLWRNLTDDQPVGLQALAARGTHTSQNRQISDYRFYRTNGRRM